MYTLSAICLRLRLHWKKYSKNRYHYFGIYCRCRSCIYLNKFIIFSINLTLQEIQFTIWCKLIGDTYLNKSNNYTHKFNKNFLFFWVYWWKGERDCYRHPYWHSGIVFVCLFVFLFTRKFSLSLNLFPPPSGIVLAWNTMRGRVLRLLDAGWISCWFRFAMRLDSIQLDWPCPLATTQSATCHIPLPWLH